MSHAEKDQGCIVGQQTCDMRWVTGVQATNGSLFPAAVVALYCTYLCYSALQSEPHDYECNSLGRRLNAASGSTLALGMVCLTQSTSSDALLYHAFPRARSLPEVCV